MKPEKKWPRWFVIAGCVLLLVFGFVYYVKSQSTDKNLAGPTPSTQPSTAQDQEKAQIEAWILKNDLNEFGDPKDIAYTGGTPLFDENSGKTKDKYEYIKEKHPDKPWKTL